MLLDLPLKSEVILYTGLSALQKKLYKAILTKDVCECWWKEIFMCVLGRGIGLS